MPEQSSNDLDPSSLTQGARLRAIADGELGAEHSAGIEDAEARIAFERALRDSVGRSMGASSGAAPPQLRAQIQAIFVAGAADEPEVVRTAMGDTRLPSFWTGLGRFAAIAAVLTICATVVIFASRFGGSAANAGTLASAVEAQHERCESDEAYTNNLVALAKTREEAESMAREHLGGVPPLIRDASASLLKAVEDAGFAFVGMAPCRVPGKGPSVQIIFRDVHSQNHIASLFIQVDRGQWDLKEGRCARLKENLEDQETVFVWLNEGFLHILFVDSAADGKALRKALGTPDQECSLKAR